MGAKSDKKAPCRPRGVPLPISLRITRLRLKPPTWRSIRLRMLLRPRRCTRRMPPVSSVWAKLRSISSPRWRTQRLPAVAADSSAVGVDRIALGLLVFPITSSAIRLAHVSANLQFGKVRHRLVRVIPLVGHHFLHRIRMHPIANTRVLLDRVEILIRLFDRLPPGGRVPLVSRLDRHAPAPRRCPYPPRAPACGPGAWCRLSSW